MRFTLAASVLPMLALANPIERRQYSIFTNTENQLNDGTPCRAITIIYARGTFEQGNVGIITGPEFFQAVANKVGSGNVAVQGIDYPADVAGFNAGGDAGGSQKFATTIGQAQSQCPQTKLCISGYSQGAQLVHNAANQITQDQTNFVNSVMLFGDPKNGTAVGNIPASKVKTDCHSDDNICQGGDNFFGSHLTYGMDADAAAAFVVQQAGL